MTRMVGEIQKQRSMRQNNNPGQTTTRIINENGFTPPPPDPGIPTAVLQGCHLYPDHR